MEVSEETNNVSQLCLQWHHHHKTLVSILDLLWEKQELVDVTLAAEGQYLQVHRIVLCACSRYFQDILTQINSNDKHAIVFLKDVDFQDLQALVHYMYKGEVRINEGQLASFLKTAKSLGVRGLMGDEAKGETTRKRQRDSSVDSSEENSQDELHIPTAPPPPPPLKHKTSLTKNIDVKRESLSNTEAGPMESPHLQTLESNHLSSTSLTTADLESNGLPLFPCPDDPGPSRTSEDDANSSEHKAGWAELHNGTDFHSEDRYSCPRCGRGYKWKQTVTRHLRYECGVDPQFACPICNASFRHKVVLMRHMKRHTNIR